MSLGEDIANNGWKSGSVLSPDDVSNLCDYLKLPVNDPAEVLDDDWLVVVSQTCDVVATTKNHESHVELLHCRPVEGKIRSQFANLRSTRRLDFRPNRATHSDLALSAHAVDDRYIVPREFLASISPNTDRELDEIAIKRLSSWYALRYSRPAWPNNFVRRVGPYRNDLETAINDLADDLEVRVSISQHDAELPATEDYTIAIYFVIDALSWEENPDVRKNAFEAYSEFVRILGECPGITVDQDESCWCSGAEFTWQQTRSSDEWNFANLSQADE